MRLAGKTTPLNAFFIQIFTPRRAAKSSRVEGCLHSLPNCEEEKRVYLSQFLHRSTWNFPLKLPNFSNP